MIEGRTHLTILTPFIPWVSLIPVKSVESGRVTAQVDKNLEKRAYTLQSGMAIVTHSRSEKEQRVLRVSCFFSFRFHFLSVKTAKNPVFEC